MGLLDSVFGGAQRPGGGMSPITLALMGLLAYRTMKGKGRLADMLGRTGAPGDPRAGASPPSGGLASGGLGGLLSGILGGSAGGLLSGGLSDLLQQFQRTGHGDTAQSWINAGPNKPIAPGELEQALGSERIEWLMHQTGMSRDELMRGLSEQLPGFVDTLTPDGRVPDKAEADRLA